MLQGSCLAPLLHTLYANDIVKIFKYAKLLMYADDISIHAIINNDVHRDALHCELNAFFALCEFCKLAAKNTK